VERFTEDGWVGLKRNSGYSRNEISILMTLFPNYLNKQTNKHRVFSEYRAVLGSMRIAKLQRRVTAMSSPPIVKYNYVTETPKYFIRLFLC
jgi:hypothetical protein